MVRVLPTNPKHTESYYLHTCSHIVFVRYLGHTTHHPIPFTDWAHNVILSSSTVKECTLFAHSVKGCIHKAMVLCDGAVYSHQKE